MLACALLDLRLGLIDLRDVVAIVEPDQFGAGLDQLIVRYRNIDDGGRDLGADLNRPGVDERVVGRIRIAWRAATRPGSQSSKTTMPIAIAIADRDAVG